MQKEPILTMYAAGLKTRKGGGGKEVTNPFVEKDEGRLPGFGAVHKPRGTILETEPMLRKHAATLAGSIAYLWVGWGDRANKVNCPYSAALLCRPELTIAVRPEFG